MANLGGITVNVTPVITVDNDTAWTLLGLLELYCRANNKTIEVSHCRPADSDEAFSVSFNFINDTGSSPVGTNELFGYIDGHPCYVVRDEYGRIVISDELMRELIERATGSSTGGAE